MKKNKKNEVYDVLEVSRHIINYSNEKDYGISNLKLQKVLYFIQAYFLVEKDSPCFKERIEAWDFGPVVPEAYHEFKKFGGLDIPTVESYLIINRRNIWDSERVDFHDNVIAKKDKKMIDEMVDEAAAYSATDLVEITHNQSPWRDVYVPDQNNEITLEALKEYFEGDE